MLSTRIVPRMAKMKPHRLGIFFSSLAVQEVSISLFTPGGKGTLT